MSEHHSKDEWITRFCFHYSASLLQILQPHIEAAAVAAWQGASSVDMERQKQVEALWGESDAQADA